MYIVYGFVYYFQISLIVLTISLSFFAIKPLRKLVFNMFNKYNLDKNQILQYVRYMSFAVIVMILLDSVFTYYSLKDSISQGSSLLLTDYDIIKSSIENHDYLAMFKKQKQFYAAERNFMLTISALIIYFMLQKFIQAINKLNSIENEMEEAEKVRNIQIGKMNIQNQINPTNYK